MNLKEYASHRGKVGLRGATHAAVIKAIGSGRLTNYSAVKENGNWQIDAEKADQEWAQNTEEPAPAAPKATAATRRAAAREAEQKKGPPDRNKSRAVKDFWEAKLSELSFKERDAQVLAAQDVKKETARWVRLIRDSVMGAPARMVDQVGNAAGGITSEQRHQILVVMDEELRLALTQVAELPLRPPDAG